MIRFVSRAFFFGTVVFCGTASPAAAQQAAPASKPAADDFVKFEKLVWQYFDSLDNFRQTDLIAREDVEPLLKKLAAAGLVVKKPDDLLNLLLTKNDFLYVELHTSAGRKFMRRIASYPDGYDRLDRLRRLPRGMQTVRDLIRGPGGERMIEYMTTAAGGKALGKQLSQDPNGANFNAPTGRIYTVRNLLDYLKEQYDAQKKAGKATAKKQS